MADVTQAADEFPASKWIPVTGVSRNLTGRLARYGRLLAARRLSSAKGA
jgi:hypothetical protein